MLECIKKGNTPSEQKWGGFCRTCKAEFAALREDLTDHIQIGRHDEEHASIMCTECKKGHVILYPKVQLNG